MVQKNLKKNKYERKKFKPRATFFIVVMEKKEKRHKKR